MKLSSRFFLFVVLPTGAILSERLPAQPLRTAAPAEPILCFGSANYRHQASIYYADLSPDGRTFFTLSHKGVYAWDLETGTSWRLFTDDRIRNTLRVSSDGTQILSISRDDVAIWDAKTGKEIKRFDRSFSASSAAFRPDGQGVIIFRDGRIEYRDLRGASQEVGKTAQYGRPAFSPDGKWFAASAPGEDFSEIVVYDAQTLEKKGRINVGAAGFGDAPSGSVMVRAGFAPGGNLIAVPGADGAIRLWDVAHGKETRALKPTLEKSERNETLYSRLLFSADGRQIFVGTHAGTIRRWDTGSGRELTPLRSHRAGITVLRLADGGRELVSACFDGVIRRWDVATGRETEPPDGYSGDLYSHVSADGRSALLLDAVGRMDIWDLRTGQLRVRVRTPAKAAIGVPWVESFFGFTADSRRVYFAEADGKITTWDAANGKELGRINLPGHTDQGSSVRFCVWSPDGGSFAVNRGRQRVALVRADTGKDVWETPDLTPQGLCYPPRFTPDGRALALGVTIKENRPPTELPGKIEAVRLEVASGKVIDRMSLDSSSRGSLTSFEQPRISLDGRILVLPYGISEANVIDLMTAKLLRRLPILGFQSSLSPNGKWLVAPPLDMIQLFEVATGKEAFRLSLGPRTVQSLHFLPDGRHVLTAGKGGLACVWDLKPSADATPVSVETACEALGAAAPNAYRAIWRLVDDPAGAAKYLAQKIQPGRVTPEVASRAVQVLELTNAPESRRLLAHWADGDLKDVLTVEAKAAISRLESHGQSGQARPR